MWRTLMISGIFLTALEHKVFFQNANSNNFCNIAVCSFPLLSVFINQAKNIFLYLLTELEEVFEERKFKGGMRNSWYAWIDNNPDLKSEEHQIVLARINLHGKTTPIKIDDGENDAVQYIYNDIL